MDETKNMPLVIASAGEAATGVALLVAPSMVVRLLFGSESPDALVLMSRIAGTALIALGIACWPGSASRGLLGMTVYSVVVAGYMAAVGLMGGQTGVLWWPAFVAHGVLSILLVRALFKE